ncbi:TIGR02710 family CRISPR-associated CARF protein [Micromonospora sp. NBC_01813]|uniref:TIGR02710 family CRISPR-associated CARF protein n=1 Tax=Micromonospora sp. NBC_01813 TaxID=2975988 RepID=UPI002DD7F542|nr:TIGR02710 family CRISPR-associated CARF protein [Micromonospora sp. NBC_01813]WSA08796.1 TIGR02710 family CRISPR-associated CARF protein [Micromonospora sp. NBC_01813]
MGSLDEKHARMRRIFRGEEKYGEGTSAEQAQAFRLAEIYDEAVEVARTNSADVERPAVDLLISLSGFSPETTLLAFALTRPARILIITSEGTQKTIDAIWEKLAGKIKFSEARHVTCDPVDPTSIYDIVLKEVRSLLTAGRPPHVIIDITGGKKAMSAGAALAASQLDLPMCYIDSTFDPEIRQALPGSERLCVLPNPTALFGDKDLTAAMAMFRSGVYSGAHALFEKLSESIAEPTQVRFLRDLAALYEAWCNLDVDGLPALIVRVREHLREKRMALAATITQRITKQLEFAEALAGRDGPTMLLNFFLLGEHYRAQGRHDFAALLYYRSIEKAFEERLSSEFGLDPVDPDYTKLGDVDGLAARYAVLTTEVYGEPTPSLPRKIALMDAMLLLCLKDDAVLKRIGWTTPSSISSMRGVVDTRNRSVLAHGTASVSMEQSVQLSGRAGALMRCFWQVYEPNQNITERIETLRFVSEL